MTPDELESARHAAASLRAGHPHLGGVADLIDSLCAWVDRLDGLAKIHAIAVYGRQVEEERAERDRLRAALAAGERLARDVGRFVEEVEEVEDVHIRRQALRLGLALADWRAAIGEKAPDWGTPTETAP